MRAATRVLRSRARGASPETISAASDLAPPEQAVRGELARAISRIYPARLTANGKAGLPGQHVPGAGDDWPCPAAACRRIGSNPFRSRVRAWAAWPTGGRRLGPLRPVEQDTITRRLSSDRINACHVASGTPVDRTTRRHRDRSPDEGPQASRAPRSARRSWIAMNWSAILADGLRLARDPRRRSSGRSGRRDELAGRVEGISAKSRGWLSSGSAPQTTTRSARFLISPSVQVTSPTAWSARSSRLVGSRSRRRCRRRPDRRAKRRLAGPRTWSPPARGSADSGPSPGSVPRVRYLPRDVAGWPSIRAAGAVVGGLSQELGPGRGSQAWRASVMRSPSTSELDVVAEAAAERADDVRLDDGSRMRSSTCAVVIARRSRKDDPATHASADRGSREGSSYRPGRRSPRAAADAGARTERIAGNHLCDSVVGRLGRVAVVDEDQLRGSAKSRLRS